MNSLIKHGACTSLVFVCLLAFGCSSSKPKTDPRFKPLENILLITPDFVRSLKDDIYRFPPAKDITGQNIYKATLSRLESYEEAYPGRFETPIYFWKAKAYERLGNYSQARTCYEKAIECAQASESVGTRLNSGDKRRLENRKEVVKQAKENLQIVSQIEKIVDRSETLSDVSDYIAFFEVRIAKLKKLLEDYKGTDYEPIIHVELERFEEQYAGFVRANRYNIKDGGTMKAKELLERLTIDHARSKKILRHYLNLADFYADLSREYVLVNDAYSPDFDLEVFNETADIAIKIYRVVSRADGHAEKTEARGKLLAFSSFIRRVREMNK